MKLKVKDTKLSSGGPFIAILNEIDTQKLDLIALDRISIKNKEKIVAVVDITSGNHIKQGEIGLFKETLSKLKVKKGDYVEVELSPAPKSVYFVKKKLDGYKLKKNEMSEIIKDVVENNLSEIELTYFVSGCYANGLTLEESIYLTKAIVENGGTLKLDKKPVCDLHSVGGIPGNKITMIVVPIIAAAGYIIPKTSTRAITSAAGTSDTVEALAKVDFTIPQIKKIVEKTNGCMVWGGAIELASADDKLIKIEHPLSLDPEGILLASIMAKKAAVNTNFLVLEIPIGGGTKIKSKKRAIHLRNKFIKIGNKLGIKIKTIITDGRQPVGNGIGPNLEIIDVLKVLKRKKDRPLDLEKKSLFFADALLKMVGSRKSAKEILESGLAYKKFKEIIKEQKGNPNKKIKAGKYKYNVLTKKRGFIKEINNKKISRIARISGSPRDKAAGIFLNFHINDKVKKNDVLFTIYATNKNKLEYAKEVALSEDIVVI